MQQTAAKLNQLTFTRFLAALSVVFFHSGRDVGVLQYIPMLTSGLTAVSYFYVLSGFVMALAYFRPDTDHFDIKRYGLARFSRIYPVYFFAFLITCLYYIDIVPKTRLKEFLANLLLYQAWIPEYSVSYNIAAWSLSVEVFFYILLPVLLFFALRVSTKKLIWFSLGFWALSQLVHSILLTGFFFSAPISFFGYFPLFHLNAFLIGFAGGVWYLNSALHRKISPVANFLLITLPLVAVAVALYFRDVQHTFGTTFYLDAGLFAPFFLVTILAFASDTSKFSKIFSHPWLVLLGDSSYALYILHVPFRWWLERILNRFSISLAPEVFLLIYIPSTIILCVLIYKYIEVPARDWLRNNPNQLLFIFLDIFLIAVMIKLAFVLRLGIYDTGFLRTQRFAIFFGVVIFFELLLLIKFYKSYSWRAFALALFFGGLSLTGLVYYAWQAEWVEGFSRLVLAMIPFLIFFSIYFSRFLIQSLNPKTFQHTQNSNK